MSGKLWVAALALMVSGVCRAGGPFEDLTAIPQIVLANDSLAEQQGREPQRLVAAALALTLGPFAAHRLYLGTDAKVPIVYGLTFGGFGVLVLIDLGHILFTKDLHAYRHNRKVLMWSKPHPDLVTPP